MDKQLPSQTPEPLPMAEQTCSTPCETCGVPNCPTRGVVQERPENALPPGRMVFSSVLVFLLPLVAALAGALLVPDWFGKEGTSQTAQAGLQWGGAAGGFCVGCLLSALVLKFSKKEPPTAA